MTKNNTYSKQEKLKSRKALEQLFAKGKSFSVFPIKVFYTVSDQLVGDVIDNPEIKINETGLVQAGVGVSSRIFKKAHDRNKVKRLLREVYRTQKQPLYTSVASNQQQLNVFFLYIGKELPVFADLQIAMEKTLEKLIRKISEPTPNVQQL
ncbi:MAG: ribonuclease P protein component [Sphingobacteriia bacterium 24-36-13]|jgi:ribonuclease P protein component|uniref:ribonuclease P protein component n=1 Tax=Sediminibacterium sp. TaxID=1917865 RepID=UPI000BD9BD26|nr:ribonuclease P protein component [Sediminibacterium sp.]OYY10773.1 MAG: ribonuclease P protein component [Sphingobacteriia bacterium 35-36-14]OYZ55133.1 MAG: ribonuclease P protein component [Sphingobacteriia bacterium 24-36-13]OZA64444.1 MAG: ribonuclease P protein component [Sphingobacteriia bacterium 39-36-14]HQS23601.1 ribonuclease P protein component [Sediminibacterium sp.]HQS34494.1 ribonuclease P protein component [Sediminibacterium sp.]